MMKKTVLAGLAAIAALGFTACNSGVTGGDKAELYSGILPAADAQGNVYTLKLDFDDDNNYTDGDYTLVESSLVSDTTTVVGIKPVAVSYTEGDFKKQSKRTGDATVDYIVLTPDAKDAMGAPSASSMYFVVNSDGTLTMVAEDLQVPANAELYTLSVVK